MDKIFRVSVVCEEYFEKVRTQVLEKGAQWCLLIRIRPFGFSQFFTIFVPINAKMVKNNAYVLQAMRIYLFYLRKQKWLILKEGYRFAAKLLSNRNGPISYCLF